LELSFTNQLLSLFLVGLFSTLHCLGMCGGIIGALSFSLPEDVRQQRWRMLPYITAYNFGRIGSYALAGALAGGLGNELFALISPQYGHLILQAVGSSVMVGIGLYLAGWFPGFAHIERLGRPLWARIEPHAQKLLPVRSPVHAFFFGILWGWLPCGLVYSTLILATSSGDTFNGTLFMLAFGLGTLPAVMTAGIVTGWITRLTRLSWVKVGVGVTLILMAVVSFYLTVQHSTGHEEHTHEHIHVH